MKKLLTISIFISMLHFVEDMVLVSVGRYTEIPIWLVIIGVILLGLSIGLLFRIPKVKKFLGE